MVAFFVATAELSCFWAQYCHSTAEIQMKSPFASNKNKYQSAQRRSLSVPNKGKLIIAVPLALQVVFIVCLTGLMHDAESKQWQQMHANAVIFEAGNLQRIMHDAGIAIGGYSITKNDMYGQRSSQIIDSIPDHLYKLRKLVVGNPRQQIAMQNLERETMHGLQMLRNARQSIKDSSQAQGMRRIRDLYDELRDTTNRMGEQIDSITNESRAVQEASSTSWERAKWAVRFFMFMALGINCLVALVLWSYYNRAVCARLAAVAENASKALRNEHLPKPVSGGDEISRLDVAIHSLAVHNQAQPTAFKQSLTDPGATNDLLADRAKTEDVILQADEAQEQNQTTK